MTTLASSRTAEQTGGGLEKGALGLSAIVFMVLAAAAPLGVVVALVPIAFAYGNGAGVPGAYLITVIALALFALGYVKIIPYVKNAGAFYAYIAAGLGKELGVAAAYVSVTAYATLSGSTLAGFAFFGSDFFNSIFGIQTHWVVWGIIGVFLVTYFAYRKITLAAAVLSILLVAEILIILALDIAIIAREGFGAFNVGDFSPNTVFSAGVGIALIYGFTSMIGIEGTAIYQEEAINRKRTVPLATFIALFLAGGFYILTIWSFSSAVGSAQVASVVGDDPGHFVFGLAETYLGAWAVWLFNLLVLTSIFAAALGLFNNAARYLFALARDGVLPESLARTHPTHHSPHLAAVVLAIFMLVIIVMGAITGLDPLLNISPAMIGIGCIGLMSLLTLTSFGVPMYFARRREFGLAKTVAPLLGGITILTATYVAATNYGALTGVEDPVINRMIWVVPIAFVAGLVVAWVIKGRDPERFAMIGSSRVEE